MADEQNKEEEPSIEEILSSICDIISDDEEEEAVQDAGEQTAPEEEVLPSAEDDDDDDDVLDLQDVVDEQDGTEIPEDNLNDVDDPLAGINLDHPSDDDLDVFDKVEETPAEDNITDENEGEDGLNDILASFENDDDNTIVEEEVIIEEAVITETDIDDVSDNTSKMDKPDDEALLNAAAQSATISALAKLTENVAISNKVSGVTLEDIVREFLRPMLKDWLDDNLPDLIEGLVAKELERLAEKASRK